MRVQICRWTAVEDTRLEKYVKNGELECHVNGLATIYRAITMRHTLCEE